MLPSVGSASGEFFRITVIRICGIRRSFHWPRTASRNTSPKNVERFFRQGIDSVEQGNWHAAGSMFRKTLEAALKHRFPDNADDLLATQIKKAAKDRNLTPEMAEWANQIRFWGNDAVHEDEPFTEEDARQMGEFTELFLTCLFTLPEKLTGARDQE